MDIGRATPAGVATVEAFLANERMGSVLMSKRQRTRRDSASPAATRPPAADRSRDSTHLVLVGMALLVGIQPISDAGLWWEMSRGRAVLQGEMAPSRHLLALDTGAEADWLGGTLPFTLYQFFGATALMVARVLAVLGFVYALNWRAGRSSGSARALLLAAALAVCKAAFDPGAKLFDLCLICLIGCWGPRMVEPGAARHGALSLAVIFCVFANLSPHVVVGVIVLLLILLAGWETHSRLTFRFAAAAMSAAVIGGCLTPRGVFTWWDSLRLTFPWLVTQSWVLQESPWKPLHLTSWGAAEWVFLLWSSLFLLVAIRDRSPTAVATWAGVQLLAWPCGANLALAGAWLACATASAMRRQGCRAIEGGADRPGPASMHAAGGAGQRRAKFDPPAGGGSVPQPPASRFWPRRGASERNLRWAAHGLTLLLILFGLELGNLGWGIDEQLDERICRLALAELAPSNNPGGTAFCDDLRSAGMLTWIAPANVKAQDVPSRALLGSRLAEQTLIQGELRSQHRASYWRDDGSRGGWWLTLTERETELLLLSARDTRLIRALEPTIWKPLALDSHVLPYARAGDARYAETMIRVLWQRDFVDVGDWTYTPPQSTGSHFDRDWWGLRSNVDHPDRARQQAAVFRAMRLHHAALKVLAPSMRRWPESGLRHEFARCQAELAHLEKLVAGAPSVFRLLALQVGEHPSEPSLPIFAGLPVGEMLDDARGLGPVATAYAEGHVEGALNRLSEPGPQHAYTAANLLVELGRPAAAAARLDDLIRGEAPVGVVRLAEHLRDKIEKAN